MRIGHGYDVHRLVKERPLVLGGVVIPHTSGLLGHSDADVLLHAAMDSILGAMAYGDIGQMFPDSDEKYKGASSAELLKKVVLILNDKGYRLNNLDCTIIAEKPKLSPYIFKMREKISSVLNVDIGRISVKATTEEGLGFTGSGFGIAAHAVCLLEE